jgi:Na+-translocating ferredoxin:NAD+ oxidoreductase RNF subunit RnfB
MGDEMKLNNCPCGGEAVAVKLRERMENKKNSPWIRMIQCIDCGSYVEAATVREAARMWNRENGKKGEERGQP